MIDEREYVTNGQVGFGYSFFVPFRLSYAKWKQQIITK